MASILAILLTLKQWAAAIAALFNFGRQVADTYQTESDKASGRAEANASTLQQNAERVKEANAAEIEGEQSHGQHPTDDDGFDKDFQRKD